VLRYTVLRLLIFFGCLIAFWLLGLREDQVLLLLVSAAVSLVLSYFLLRRQREEFAVRIAARVEQRQQARRQAMSDEQAEDSEASTPQDGEVDRP
jgi:mannitol-specific phosphotransferase system IIBC component